MSANRPTPTAQPLLPHERLYAAARAMHSARTPEQMRNAQADFDQERHVDEQRRRYNLS